MTRGGEKPSVPQWSGGVALSCECGSDEVITVSQIPLEAFPQDVPLWVTIMAHTENREGVRIFQEGNEKELVTVGPGQFAQFHALSAEHGEQLRIHALSTDRMRCVVTEKPWDPSL